MAVTMGRAAAVTVLVATTVLGSAGAARAGAGQPTLTVTPREGLHAGDVVQVAAAGFTRRIGVAECDAAVGTAPDAAAIVDNCGFPAVIDGDAGSVALPIDDAFVPFASPAPHPVRCGDEPHDCVVVAFSSVVDPEVTSFVSAPIEVVPAPLGVAPTADVPSGTDVSVFAAGIPGGGVAVAECATPPGRTLATSRCGPAVPVLLDGAGNGRAPLTVTATVATRSGPVSCDVDPCAVVEFAATRPSPGATVAAVPITVVRPFDPLAVTVTPDAGLARTDRVDVSVTGRQDLAVTVAECSSAVVESLHGCRTLGTLDPGPRQQAARVLDTEVLDAFAPDANAPRTLCAGDDGRGHGCVIAVTGIGSSVLEATAPLTFTAPRRLTLDPSDDLVDQQELAVTAAGLDPGTSYAVVHCAADVTVLEPDPHCEDAAGAPHLTAAADGTLTGAVPALQRFTSADGQPWRCRHDCVVGLLTGDDLYVAARQAMADGTLDVAPAAELVDGQAVTVSGHRLMASYDAPPLWFLAPGRWGLAQCEAEVVADPSLHGVFERCQAPTPDRAVAVPGSDLSTTFTVHDHITTPTGRTTDCRQDPCVLVLGRVEQDGDLSFHHTALQFAPS
ncbi:MAG TPA: neocarzinostatin apoprotein domain-containing protein [Acidimicrobiales bacterium]|nr:neocarzinostatin apoprotein domain-containing protein [Acidimicrobiales bacterium]